MNTAEDLASFEVLLGKWLDTLYRTTIQFLIGLRGVTGNMGYLTTFGHTFFSDGNKVMPTSQVCLIWFKLTLYFQN